MENSELHDDMLIEIFSRLPAKSVGKFRCLSKAWCTHLSTPQFINLHLITTRKNNQSQLFLKNSDKNYSCIYIPRIEDACATTKVELSCYTYWFGVVNSCNGLVLLWANHLFILVNPITRQNVQVPNPISRSTHYYGLGLGYDSCSDDYKIVFYNCCGVDTNTLYVYSVKSKVWKRASSSPKYPIGIGMECYKGVFTNGAIHWIAISSCICIIVAFNLTDEVFYYIPFPASARDWRFPCSCIYLLEGCLCVIDRLPNCKDDIWLMKEYGVQDSWTRFTVIHRGLYCGTYQPLCFIGEEAIVLLNSFVGKVIVYDLVGGTAKDMIVDGDYTDGVAFSDSLLSLSSDQHVLSS